MPIKRIMVVDDSPTERAYIENLLKKKGYEVLLVDSGEKAIERSKADQPDLILMDVVMPKMNGFDACKRIRQEATTKDIPIIMVTTRGEPENVEIGFASGCNDYITKPINSLELLAKLDNFLGD